MKYDGSIDIAIGMSAKSKTWRNKKILWSELSMKLSAVHKTTETYKEYMSANKEEQSKIKDVGGYVGGYLRGGRRKPENVVHRQLLTLDIDYAHNDFWDDYCLQFDNAAILHATHKHSDENPRYRLIMPLSREATPDEYVAVSRKIAGILNIDLFDNTTFEPNRLMFWPSVPIDVDYYYEMQDGPFIDVDEILNQYPDWTDSSLWPTADKQFQDIKNRVKKQEDPEDKKGIVGAFCRTYTMTEVIDLFLEDVYDKADENRYTFLNGTTACGLIVYDDKFAYSHHGTDPCNGRLCNAFDIVRIHKFRHLDNGDDRESFKAMEEFARLDTNVKKTIAQELIDSSRYDFADTDSDKDDNIDWMQDLEVDSRGEYLSSSTNLNLIFTNDAHLKDAFKHNCFDNKNYICCTVPWRRVLKPEPIRNVDFSGIRNYIESVYGIVANLKVDDAISLTFEKHSFHPIKVYLQNVKWDGVKRIDELLIKYFNAHDNIYTREAMRKMMVGAVARVMNPGCKFDLVLTLVCQQQGTGKSSFFRALGKQWFSDSFSTVQGKESYEQLHGAWIIEMAELSGIRKAEVESVKHFISKQEDMFRPAYGRVSETFLRQCVFVATTNQSAFLKDSSGNRRFMPIDTHEVKLSDNKELMDFLKDEKLIDQLWAEAFELYDCGEELSLSKEAEDIAEVEQHEHAEMDSRKGLIEMYLNTKLPKDWDDKDVYERRTYLNDPLSAKGTVEREFVCVAEIWCECLGKDKEDMDCYKTREINDIVRSLSDWKQVNSTKMFKIYGCQKYYRIRKATRGKA